MKFALIHEATGAVLQWQDRSLFNFAEPSEGLVLKELPGNFKFPAEPTWLVGGKFTQTAPELPPPETPPAVVPRAVSARQARLELLAQGKLAAVADALDALPAAQRDAAKIEWEFATTIDRSSPLVALLGQKLKLDLDALFAAAALR